MITIKTHAMKAMIQKQFPWAEDIELDFTIDETGKETIKVTLNDEGTPREFILTIDLKEVEL
jgi:hypothetical protein